MGKIINLKNRQPTAFVLMVETYKGFRFLKSYSTNRIFTGWCLSSAKLFKVDNLTDLEAFEKMLKDNGYSIKRVTASTTPCFDCGQCLATIPQLRIETEPKVIYETIQLKKVACY